MGIKTPDPIKKIAIKKVSVEGLERWGYSKKYKKKKGK